MAKLTAGSLTQEQLDLMKTVRQEYIDALTKDFDDKEIIKKVKWFYELYGLRNPQVHILDSPQQYKLEHAERFHKGVYAQDDDVINKHLYELWRQLQKSVDESTLNLAKREILQKINGKYENHIALERVIRSAIWNVPRLSDIGKEQNIPLLSLYDYFLRIGIIKDPSENNDAEKFIAYMRSGIMYRLYNQGRAYIVRNNNGPQFRDELGRLNNEEGYAVVWRINREGKIESGLHFVKGVYFQPDLFDKIFIKENISSKEIFDLRNVEQKAVALHHIGYDKFLKELNAKKLDTWTTASVINGNVAVCDLYQFKLDSGILRFVKVQDHSTGKKTVLGVPVIEDTATAKGAVAWTFGKKPDEYGPTIET
jgi:hypothetical protein